MNYNAQEIEKKWQQRWAQDETYRVEERQDKPKYYVLNMFPYPSGAGLHVGHPLGYIASDIYARYKRMKGFNVLNPMGYDAYGLPAEQYAIQTGQHPALTTEQNINRYREQLDKIGFSFDWSREVRTCDPGYYKWTQWAFQQMFNSYYDTALQKARPIQELIAHLETEGTSGLTAQGTEELCLTAQEWKALDEAGRERVLMNYRIAYLGEMMVNWCAGLGTVLANDEVVEGLSIRGGYPVEQKRMKQWCLRVSAYAQRLLDGLDTIDWTDSLKETQRNWIGRSEGAEVEFSVKDSDLRFTIFTTRADTMFGVTFMVLAPESELVEKLTTAGQREAVTAYVEQTKKKTERDRIAATHKTGVFTGSYAINPFTGDEVPIWVSDYVLAGYGTGAIMAVPAHDGRDYAFAKEFGLPIIPLIEGCDVSQESFDAKEGIVINSPTGAPPYPPCRGENEMSFQRETADPVLYDILKENAKNHRHDPTEAEAMLWAHLRGGALGVSFRKQHIIGDYIADFICLEKQLIIEVDGGYHNEPEQREKDKLRTEYFNKRRYREIRFTNEEVLVDIDGVIKKISDALASSPLQGGTGGALVLNGLTVKEAIAATKKYVAEHGLGRVKVNYRLRDAIFSRQRYWGEPFPVYYENGLPRMIPEECLPLELPEVERFLPTAAGDPPLGNATRWAWDTERREVVENSRIDGKTVFPLELNTMPGFAGSSAYYLRYMDPRNEEALVAKEKDSYWRSVDLYIGGTEHATGHLIYSRFWNKFLHDIGVSCEEEPFHKLVNQGMIQGRSNFVYRIQGTNTFVSLGLKDQYEVTPIHVDVNIVSNDVLDLDAFRKWRPEYSDAEFVLEDGRYICGWAVEKMSKSMFNVVNPDMIVERYGADTLRLYEMFLGPIRMSKPWDNNGIDGCSRFLKKLWNLFWRGEEFLPNEEPASEESLRSINRLIKKVSNDIEIYSYNTAISAFMICVSELGAQKCTNREVLSTLVRLLCPFTPHVCEELWEQLGNRTTVCDAEWPQWDEAYLKEATDTLSVSFNGKTRFTITLPAAATREQAEQAALTDPAAQKYLAGKQVVKVIVVPKRIVNIVIR